MDFASCNAVTADCAADKIAIGSNCYQAAIQSAADPANLSAGNPPIPQIHLYSTYQYGKFTKSLKDPFQTSFLDCALQCVQNPACQSFSFQQPNSTALDIPTQGTCKLGSYWLPLPPDKGTFTLDPADSCQVVYARSNFAQLQFLYTSGNQPAIISWAAGKSCNCAAADSRKWATVYQTATPSVLAGFDGVYGNIITALWRVNKLAFNANIVNNTEIDIGSWDCAPDCSNCSCFSVGAMSWGISSLTCFLNGDCHLIGMTLNQMYIYDHRIQKSINVGNPDGSGNNYVQEISPPRGLAGAFLTDLEWSYANHKGDGVHCILDARYVTLGITGDMSQLSVPAFWQYLATCNSWVYTQKNQKPIPVTVTPVALTPQQTYPTDLQDQNHQTTVFQMKDAQGNSFGMIYANMCMDPGNYGIIIKWDGSAVEHTTVAFSEMAGDGSVTTVDGFLILQPAGTCAPPVPAPTDALITLHSTSGAAITIDPGSAQVAPVKPLLQANNGGVQCRQQLSSNTYDDSDPAAKTAMQNMQAWCSDPDHKDIETCVKFCQNPAYTAYCPWASTESRDVVFGLIGGWLAVIFLGILLYRSQGLPVRVRQVLLVLAGIALVTLPILFVPKLIRLIQGQYGGGNTTKPEYPPPETQVPASVQEICPQGACQFPQCKDFLAGGDSGCYCPNACTVNQCKNNAPCIPGTSGLNDYSCDCSVISPAPPSLISRAAYCSQQPGGVCTAPQVYYGKNCDQIGTPSGVAVGMGDCYPNPDCQIFDPPAVCINGPAIPLGSSAVRVCP